MLEKADYPTNSDLATQLSNYETHTGVANKLNNYVTKTNFNNALGGMLTISQANGTYAKKTQADSNTTEINNLKSTVVSGKTSVANAINGKLGTTLSNQTSFADMAYYINTIKMFSLDNLYVGGCYAPTPSGVGITHVIFKTISNSKGGSRSEGDTEVEFTNNVAGNTCRITKIWTTHDGKRIKSNSTKTINKTGIVSTSFSYGSMDGDEASMICVAIFNNPVYNFKSVETGNEYNFICIP